MKVLAIFALCAMVQSPVVDDPIPPVLMRDPRTLPRAEAGAWKEWEMSSPMPQSHGARIHAAAQAYGRRELPLALEHMLAVLEELPDCPPLLHQSGVIYFKLRRYRDAQEMFERFVRVAPDLAGHTRVLGHCYYSLGDYDKAHDHYERVLAADPATLEARRGLGLTVMRQGDSARALEELGKVVAAAPDHADAWTWIAQIHYDEDRSDEALAALKEAQEIDPFDSRSWYLLGQVHYDRGDDVAGDRAHQRYSELYRIAQDVRSVERRLAIAPHQPDVIRRLIRLHHSVGNRARVRQGIALLIHEDPSSIAIRIEVLNALVSMGDEEGAEAAALSLERMAGENAAALERLERYRGK